MDLRKSAAKRLQCASILEPADTEELYNLRTDASGYTLGPALAQAAEGGKKGMGATNMQWSMAATCWRLQIVTTVAQSENLLLLYGP